MAVDPVAAHGPSRGIDLEDTWKRIASARLGVRPDELAFIFSHFVYGDRGARSTGLAISTGTQVGIVNGTRLQTINATVNTGRVCPFSFQGGGGTPNITLPIQTLSTAKWWIASRFAVETAVGANTLAGVGCAVDTATALNMSIGVRGASSTTNYYLYGDAGTPIDTGVAIDTAEHEFEALRDGATTFAYIDRRLRATGDARPAADAGPSVRLFEADSTTPRTMAVRWAACAVVLPRL